MPDFDTIKCEGCGKDLAIPKGSSPPVRYHRACAWYELPCDICGNPMQIHREWEHPPRAHKACKDAAKAEFYSKPCEHCGGPIRVHINAVKVPKYHKRCEAKARAAAPRTAESDLPHLTVFLCHSSVDKPRIRDLYKRLRKDGFAPWLDEEELLPGQDWHHEITKAVRSSHVVVVCLSSGSTAKTGYVQKEIKYALDIADEQPEETIFLIPLKLEECEVPSRLQRWQWVELFEETGYQRLLRALKLRQEHERSAAAIIRSSEKDSKTV
jgi:hypothetical protein